MICFNAMPDEPNNPQSSVSSDSSSSDSSSSSSSIVSVVAEEIGTTDNIPENMVVVPIPEAVNGEEQASEIGNQIGSGQNNRTLEPSRVAVAAGIMFFSAALGGVGGSLIYQGHDSNDERINNFYLGIAVGSAAGLIIAGAYNSISQTDRFRESTAQVQEFFNQLQEPFNRRAGLNSDGNAVSDDVSFVEMELARRDDANAPDNSHGRG